MLSENGRNILGNTFIRIERSGKIIDSEWDIMCRGNAVDSGSIHIPDAMEVESRNVREALDNVRAEQAAFRAARKNPPSQ